MTGNTTAENRTKKPRTAAGSVEFPLSCVIMAAGVSRRFQDPITTEGAPVKANKLTVDFLGKPLLKWTLDCFAQLDCRSRIVVVREADTEAAVPADAFQLVWNTDEDTSPSITIRYGLSAVPGAVLGCLFAVGDQPSLTYASVRRLCEVFRDNPENIVSLAWKEQRGNPVIFPRSLFPELLTLKGGSTGRAVIESHPELLIKVDADKPEELMDIDTRKQYLEACESCLSARDPHQK